MQEICDQYDVIAVGSGAAGMLAAIRAHDEGLTAVVVERSPLYGGTSATSGGEFWIPGNHLMTDQDSDELAKAYLDAASGGEIRRDFLERYLAGGREMVRYLQTLGFTLVSHAGRPDYRSSYPGATGGRSLTIAPIDGPTILDDEFLKQREAANFFTLLGRYSLTAEEGGMLLLGLPGWRRMLARLLMKYWLDVAWRRRTRRDRRLTLGGALVGSLRKAMLERSIPLLLNTELVELTKSGDAVTGGRFRHLGQERVICANRAVILTTGGYEHNQRMRDEHLPVPTRSEWSMAPGTNTGDGIRAGVAAGAGTELLDQVHWWPTTLLPNGTANALSTHFVFRNPHSIIVNRRGERFLNESCNYDDFGKRMVENQEATGAAVPCWIVFDADCRRDYLCGGLMPGRFKPDRGLPSEWWDTYVFRASTLAELARKIAVSPEALAASVAKANEFARTGKDLAFGRGDHAYDRILGGGDPKIRPNPCLAPIARAPFYALRVFLGDLGTRGGLKTNPNAQVLTPGGVPIPGLYAAGNTATNVFRNCYPGPGATLGPAMSFAYIAATHIAASAGKISAAAQYQHAARELSNRP